MVVAKTEDAFEELQLARGTVRPSEEIIELQFDDENRVKVERPNKRARARQAAEEEQEKNDARKKSDKGEPKRLKGARGVTKKFQRPGENERFKGVRNKRLAAHLEKNWRQEREAVSMLVRSEVLQTAEPGSLESDRRRITQDELVRDVTLGASRKRFELTLPYGAYSCGFTGNGSHMVAGGRKGHIAMLACEGMQLSTELYVKETVRAVQFLHNYSMFAVAQKKYMYIYDHGGIELHCLKTHGAPSHLDFLPYHYLLVSGSDYGDLRYRDVSTGEEICSRKTGLGAVRALRHNPSNAVVHVGHVNGTVTLWSPSVKEPLAKVFCSPGQVTSLAVSNNHMVTAASNGIWKVWDLRQYKVLHAFRGHGHAVNDMDVSMTGCVSLGFGSHVQVWNKVFSTARPDATYMSEEYPGKIVSSVRFRPYEDVCAVGHSGGFGTIIIPGAGYANFDSFEQNPFQTKQQRREREVRTLLEKLQPDSIMLDPDQLGNLNKEASERFKKEEAQKKQEEEAEKKKGTKEKKKMRGRNKVGKRMKRKQLKTGAEERSKVKNRLNGKDDESQSDDSGSEELQGPGGQGGTRPIPEKVDGAALSRFYGKRRKLDLQDR
mmetsp:Transcript_9500/g.26570  ORF Transcript_9500/g.26570 Transcript_9500/m.26570 type:complete len:604 (-) Transcript_9500:146-1957(-)|eukprot:CAMPEP_0194485008 /NCGR_PEP_ID=MMETSP0253-20130528/6146_1 /TAXON_ID=2966 /ORGANISM="Noctiluca scintillans" /LENGTH=603 /DNA_ID=CAMNT_0039324915 /DNA_START=139 /DNA_END=1950 /DNA_ORIENTATION=-